MSFNGSGTFVINSAGQPVVANTVISATTFNALTADLANGLTTCITKDGQTTPTANIPMGGFKITNLATGTAATDAATVAQIQSNGAALVTVTGTDTLTGSLTPALVAYVTGAVYYFVAPAANTGAVTLNIDTLGAKNVTRDGTTALVAGDIVSGEMVAVVYDGTRFQLISPVNSFTNLNVSGTLTVAGTATLNGNVAIGDAAADTINFKSSGWTLTNNVSVIGTWADIGTITTADINGGTIDGTTIGGGTAAAGTFTTATATTGNITTVNATTVDSTNLEVTNLKAKDGTAAGSIADATGVVTLNSVVATTADINGGTIDATTIGGSSPAVGNFTTVSAASAVFTTATITTVNTTTLDLTNLEVTNIKAKDGTASMTIDDATGKVNATTVSAASMNAGVAAVTSLTATGASVASANVGTAVITNGTVTALTATGASIASMNAGVALLTTATVTNFTASGASIASANIGNLQFTAASIASINAGVAVITNLTATGASIASANVGTAVITAATVTGASIASMNAGVALLTTATVTSLTATGASVASANVGTAVVTGLTVTGASIASVNAGVAVLSGNLTLNGGTANGVLYLNGSKVATSGSGFTYDGTSALISGGNLRVDRATNTTTVTLGGSPSANWEGDLIFATSNTQINWRIASNRVSGGALTFTPSTAAGGSTFTTPAMTIDNASNLGIGTASPGAYRLNVQGGSSSFTYNAANQYAGEFYNSNATGYGLYVQGGGAGSRAALNVLDYAGASILYAGNGNNVGIGTSSPGQKLDVVGSGLFTVSGSNQSIILNTSNNAQNYNGLINFQRQGSVKFYAALDANDNLAFLNSSASGLLTLDSSGNLGLGVTPSAWATAGAQKALEVSLAGLSYYGAGNTVSRLTHNAYFDGTNWKYVATNVGATRYDMTGANAGSTHAWFTSVGGTANTTISFTQAMTLDASGNLFCGGTTGSSRLNLQTTTNSSTDSNYITMYNAGENVGHINWINGNGDLARITGTKTGAGASANDGILTFSTALDTVLGERARITAGGYFKASNAGTYAGSAATYHEFSQSADDSCLVLAPTNASFTSSGLFIAASRAANAAYYMIRARANAVDQFYVTGNGVLYAQNTTIQSLSDARLKENVRDASDGLSVINALRPVRYDWKAGYGNDRKDQLGFIAQEVEVVFPDAVSEWAAKEGEEAYKTVGPAALIPVLVKAIQELSAKVAALEAK